jgi:hypothetical protein
MFISLFTALQMKSESTLPRKNANKKGFAGVGFGFFGTGTAFGARFRVE